MNISTEDIKDFNKFTKKLLLKFAMKNLNDIIRL